MLLRRMTAAFEFALFATASAPANAAAPAAANAFPAVGHSGVPRHRRLLRSRAGQSVSFFPLGRDRLASVWRYHAIFTRSAAK